jgi:hypothetical protein
MSGSIVMKLLMMFTLVFLAAGAIFSRGQVPVTKTEELVREIDARLASALLRGDPTSVDAILADDYIEVNAQGLVKNKSDVMTTVRAQASAPRSVSVGPEIRVDETKVRSYGDTTILTSLKTTRNQHMENQALPQPSPLSTQSDTYQERLMRVYSKLKGHWQLVASQTTAIAKH